MTLNSAGLNPSKYDKTEVKVKYIIVPYINMYLPKPQTPLLT